MICNTILLARKAKSPFYFENKGWPYGDWHMYFRSLRSYPGFRIGTSVETYPLTGVPQTLFPLAEYKVVLQEILQFQPRLVNRVKQLTGRIGTPYTALFVRRGDKITSGEAKFVAMKDILSHVKYDENTVFFVQTDDYAVIEEMRTLLPNTIHHTVPETKRGAHLYSFKDKPLEQKREEIDEMLVGLWVCLAAKERWSDDTSNVGRFLKLYDDTTHIYPEDYSLNLTKMAHPAWSF